MNELSEYVSEQIHEIIPSYNEDDFKEFHITPEETLFVYKYAELNDTGKAYQIVYGETNYTKARSAGAKLLKRKEIQNALTRMQNQIFDYALQSLPLAMMQDIQLIRSIDPLDFYTPDGTARPLDQIPANMRHWAIPRHIINNKTGEVIMTFDLPDPTKTTSLMVELMRAKDMAKGTDGDKSLSDAMKAAQEQRNKVFSSINMEELKK